MKFQLPKVEVCSDLASTDFDSVVVVAPTVNDLPFDKLKSPLASVS